MSSGWRSRAPPLYRAERCSSASCGQLSGRYENWNLVLAQRDDRRRYWRNRAKHRRRRASPTGRITASGKVSGPRPREEIRRIAGAVVAPGFSSPATPH
jgi:hypothetical protein